MTLFLDADLYESPEALHKALKRLLTLPDYYGMNLDALHDCLSERVVPLNLYVASRGHDEVARLVDIICEMVTDLGGTVKTA